MRSRTLVAIGGLALTSISGMACQRTELAPDCYNDDCSLPGSADISDSEFTCDDMDIGAIDAFYSYTPAATGVWTNWSAEDLPSGLTIDSTTGTITGTPTEEGTFTITVAATAEFESSPYETECELTVNPELEILPGIEALPMHCVTPDVLENGALEDLITAGTGTGGLLGCSPFAPATNPVCPLGPGNGAMPMRTDLTPRVEIDTNCEFDFGNHETDWHTPNEIPSGTHVWVVEAMQDSHVVYIPFCITKAADPDHVHAISTAYTDHEGATVTDVNQPLLLSGFAGYSHDAAVAYGNGAAGEPNPDPLLSYNDADCDPGFCDFDGQLAVTSCSPISSTTIAPVNPIDGGGGITGWEHGLALTGGEAPDEWNGGAVAGRPWVATSYFSYCTGNDDLDCDDLPDESDTGYVWAAIVYPD